MKAGAVARWRGAGAVVAGLVAATNGGERRAVGGAGAAETEVVQRERGEEDCAVAF